MELQGNIRVVEYLSKKKAPFLKKIYLRKKKLNKSGQSLDQISLFTLKIVNGLIFKSYS